MANTKQPKKKLSTSNQRKTTRKPQTKQAKPQQSLLTTGILAVLAVGAMLFFFATQPSTAPVDPDLWAQADANPAALMSDTPQRIGPQEYVGNIRNENVDHILLDVRTPGEYYSGAVDGAINIAVEELANRLSELPQDVPIVLYCRSGNRSAQAARILDQAGFEGVYDMGGTIHWTQAGYSLIRPA